MLTLWLIRHGETTSNARLPAVEAGSAGNLTARGYLQAEQIAAALPHSPDLIVTSPLWRTKHTAEPVCKRFPTVPQVEWAVQEFSYLAAKAYDNAKTIEQRRLLDQDYWQRADPDYVSGAGAESFASLMTRVRLIQDRLHQLASANDSNSFVLVFSHAWFMRAVIWSLVNQSTEISPQQMWRLHHFAGGLSIPNGAIFKVQVCASEIWFTGVNTAHLCELMDQI
jgi:broad specificity phosphatase PhoE